MYRPASVPGPVWAKSSHSGRVAPLLGSISVCPLPCMVSFYRIWSRSMALIVSRDEAEGILTLERAIQILEPVMIEEVQGTASHITPTGGGRSLRLVGGILKGMGRMGVRVRGQASLYDTASGQLLGIVSYRGGM